MKKLASRCRPLAVVAAAFLAAICAAASAQAISGGPRVPAACFLPSGGKIMPDEYLGYEYSSGNLFLEEDDPPEATEDIATAPVAKLRGVARQLWAATTLIKPLVQGDMDTDVAAGAIEAVLHQVGAQVEELIGELHALENSIGKTPLVWIISEHVHLDFPKLAAGLPEYWRERPYQAVVNAALRHMAHGRRAAEIVGYYGSEMAGKLPEKPDEPCDAPAAAQNANKTAPDVDREVLLAKLIESLKGKSTAVLMGLFCEFLEEPGQPRAESNLETEMAKIIPVLFRFSASEVRSLRQRLEGMLKQREQAEAVPPPQAGKPAAPQPKKNAPKTGQGFAGRIRKASSK